MNVPVAAPSDGLSSTAPAAGTRAASAPRARSASSAVPEVALFAIVLAVGILAIVPYPLGVFTDDGMYAILAESMATGRGYRFVNLPGAPSATHFPPVYPALLAAAWKVMPAFPQNVLLFKALNALLSAIAAVLAFRFGRRTLGLPPALAMAAALFGGLAIPAMVLTGMVMSEPLYLVMLLALLPFAESVAAHPTTRRALLLGAACGVLMLTRSVGLSLLAACVAVLAFRRHWRHAALVGVAAAVLLAPWQWWVAAHQHDLPPDLQGKYGSYSGWLGAGIEREGLSLILESARGNVVQAVRMVAEPLRPPGVPGSDAALVIAGCIAAALGVAGAVRLARRAPVAALTLAAYTSIVLLWPFEPTRFFWAMWPLVMLLVAAGVAEALAVRDAPSRPRRIVGRVGLAAAALLAVGMTGHAVKGHARGWSSSIARSRERTALPVLSYVLDNTRPDEIIASNEEPMVYLYTGRRGTPLTTFTADEYVRPLSIPAQAAAMERIVRHYRPDVLVASMPASRDAARLLASRHPGLLRIVAERPGLLILRPTTHE